MRALIRCLTLALLTVAPPTLADQVTSGDITLHYSVLPTTSLTPDVAREYGITRSNNRALLNIALRRATDGVDEAIAARVRAWATNTVGQRQDIRLREVREGEAIYYLGEVRVSHEETLSFEVEAHVDGRDVQARFRQQFFVAR